MTEAEIKAFNSGILTVLELARRTAAAIEARIVLRPTRYNFAAEALKALADEGRTLRKGAGDGFQGETNPSLPNPPTDLSGAAAKARAAYVERIPAGDDGRFGLTDEQIARPSRETIINWLGGKTPMLASHWSRIAADMIRKDADASTIHMATHN